MPLAARVTDPTTHGAPLSPGPGSTNVMIGGLPAWRTMIDQHACPAVSASGADGVGCVVMGSPTVLINSQMACRQMDIVIEKPGLAMGPVNPIGTGCPNVRIGETAVGLAGLPVAVNDDGSISVGSNITITGYDPMNLARVMRDLRLIASTPSGRALLAARESSKYKLDIHPKDPPDNPPNAGAGALDPQAATPAGKGVFDGAGKPINSYWGLGSQQIGTGEGSDSSLDYNPDQWPGSGYRTDPPGDAILFHEMTHAEHQADGTQDCSPRADNYDTNEEFNTIGPENTYRDERGIPQRNDHHDL